MSVVLGKNLQIFAGSSGTSPIIAMAKSCTVSRKCDMIEKASATQGTAKEYNPGREEWEIRLSHLVSSDAPLDGLLKLRQKYTLRVSVEGQTLTGTAICMDADLSGAVGTVGNGSVKFKGTGPLS